MWIDLLLSSLTSFRCRLIGVRGQLGAGLILDRSQLGAGLIVELGQLGAGLIVEAIVLATAGIVM